jgi:hypothetical protein
MLFILVMDVLGHMIETAAREGMLQPPARWTLQHGISLYADDVALFIRPQADDSADDVHFFQWQSSQKLETGNIHFSGLIDGLMGKVFRTWLPYSFLPSHKDEDDNIL